MSTLILSPKVSEKAIAMAEHGIYVFEVPTSTNKIEVAKAVAERFKVEVTEVNMLIAKGKVKRFRRQKGTEKDVKKAMVHIKAGQSIKLFEAGK